MGNDFINTGFTYKNVNARFSDYKGWLADQNSFNIKYEDLVNNQEEVSKKIIKFCDLKWNEKCLKFYESTTPVHTVSLYQSRKPMYKTSVNLNSKYSKYRDFFEKLENL